MCLRKLNLQNGTLVDFLDSKKQNNLDIFSKKNLKIFNIIA